jgi:fluoroquinolone transport system permease protein
MYNFRGLLSLTIYNIKLQLRQGFYFAWLFMTLFYLILLYFLPQNMRRLILPLILLSEPSTFAMIFTGAIVLLERDDKMLENLFITPLSVRTYIYSKMISISIPATICTVIIVGLNGIITIRLLLIIPAVILTTYFCVVFSLLISASARTIISLMGRIALYGSVFCLSILDYFGILNGYFQYILPTKGALVLISTATGYNNHSIFELILSLSTMIIAIIIILIPAEQTFYKKIIQQGGK